MKFQRRLRLICLLSAMPVIAESQTDIERLTEICMTWRGDLATTIKPMIAQKWRYASPGDANQLATIEAVSQLVARYEDPAEPVPELDTLSEKEVALSKQIARREEIITDLLRTSDPLNRTFLISEKVSRSAGVDYWEDFASLSCWMHGRWSADDSLMVKDIELELTQRTNVGSGPYYSADIVGPILPTRISVNFYDTDQMIALPEPRIGADFSVFIVAYH